MQTADKPLIFGFHPNQVMGGTADIARSIGGTMNSSDPGGFIDDSPQIIAGIVLGALITLVALKGLGFRFAIGVGS